MFADGVVAGTLRCSFTRRTVGRIDVFSWRVGRVAPLSPLRWGVLRFCRTAKAQRTRRVLILKS